MKWHVFNLDRYDSEHSSYEDAVRHAQGLLLTDRRPTRLHAGFYNLVEAASRISEMSEVLAGIPEFAQRRSE